MKSIKELRKLCRSHGDKYHVTIRFWHFFSIYITRIVLSLKIKPNFITILGFLLGIAGGILYLNSYFLIGSLLFLASFIFDCVDGEVARYWKLSSKFGAWLDSTAIHLLYPYFFFTLGLGIFFQTGELCYIILGSLSAIAKLVERSIWQPVIKGRNQGLSKGRSVASINSIKTWISHIAKAPVLFSVIILCSIVGWEIYFLWLFAIYSVFLALGKVFLVGWRIYSSEK